MCGFAGFITKKKFDFDRILETMGIAIFSRGPDSSGNWFNTEAGVGFVHRRLSIVDLSEAGHQPMHSNCGRYVLSYNGEVYNHLDLRKEIDQINKINWRGHSDTETLLAAFSQWGVKKTLSKAVGMFALALWDNEKNSLILARDRFGEKPLYYGFSGEDFIFGSQLNSLRAYPGFKGIINRDSLTLLLRHNYIPAPYSVYTDIFKLMPGKYLTFDSENKIKIDEYWCAKDVINTISNSKQIKSDEQHLSELETILKKSISDQMLADVPLGAFLSGGVDSSLVVGIMQSLSKLPVKTFSIGFDDKRFNEAEFAKEVALHLGTEHTELYVTADDALSVIPKLADIYDEPFSDSSQIPTYLVSSLAKKHVTVSLSGDAGDELFCGYTRYTLTALTWAKISRIPLFVRKMLSKSILALSESTWNKFFRYFLGKNSSVNYGDKIHKAAKLLLSPDIQHLYLNLVSHWKNPESVVLSANEPLTVFTDKERSPSLNDPILQMMSSDVLSYLPDDILVKVDRAAMAVSLETRVPFLDHRVFEKAWELPLSLKLRDKTQKWCLRQILYKYVPKNLIERPKMGFAVPLDAWLRGPLKDWADNLLNEKRLIEEGYFDAKVIRRMWDEHLACTHDWQYHLWDILMFQLWYQKYHK